VINPCEAAVTTAYASETRVPERCDYNGRSLEGCETQPAERSAIQLDVVWNAGTGLELEWPIHRGYTMEVEDCPNVQTRVEFSFAPEQIQSGRIADLANPVTAMPVMNAIPEACDGELATRTRADLPLITGRSVAY
jgi:hypothetical protein